jgi:MOSC domain-containing protein YiiM
MQGNHEDGRSGTRVQLEVVERGMQSGGRGHQGRILDQGRVTPGQPLNVLVSSCVRIRVTERGIVREVG